jgi:hypothetical protein
VKNQFAGLALAAAFLSFVPHAGAEIREVDVTGGRIAGVSTNGIVSFKGVPFAAPPARSLRVLWDFDTARDYQTANGVPGKGGSLDGAGPVVAGGKVFVNSGYARNGGSRAMYCWRSSRRSRNWG